MTGSSERSRRWRSLFGRIARNDHGNALIITAAALVPLLALVGSGVDMSRAYMAQARLQQACDAASLAGRRVMTGGNLDSNVTSEANKFFNFNFPQGTWNTDPFTPVVKLGTDSTLVITASTRIKTSIMSFFGFTTLPLSVACDAKQDFVNTDIVLVLDTTGSMADKASSGDTDTKIVALRKAVLALYDELSSVQTKLAAAGLRLRYGIVPFSSGINARDAIMAASPSYIVSDSWTYQTRQVAETSPGSVSAYNCTRYYSGGYYVTTTRTCRYFTYGQRSLDVSRYVAGADVDVTPTVGPDSLANPQPRITRWEGCIEERQTSSSITSGSGYSIPSNAYDLDLATIPSSQATRWKPYWPEVEYRPDYGTKPQVACPNAAVTRLKTWTRSDLSSFLDTLNPDGGTYHDNGMIWGARLLARTGIFANDNPETYGAMPVSRQIIYMTDGIIDTGPTLYSTYGMEQWDQRVTGRWTNEDDQTARHNQRFKMMCAATKQMGVSVWVIAFASALTDTLSECATSASQASISANSAGLTTKFVEIGKNIGALRLTK